MKLNLQNIPSHLCDGVKEFLTFHGHSLDGYGVPVAFSVEDNVGLKVEKQGEGFRICAQEEGLIFRALTRIFAEDFGTEPVFCSTRGVMIDGSQQSALLNVSTCKLFLRIAAGMGYNMFMLYMEDCYDIEGEPYFGWMRPRYTQKELKELDDYAYSLGIEMIPCMQTLGHLTEVLKRSKPYGGFKEDSSTLLVGDDRTYALIEKMIAAASAPFRTKRIHIGMDEAFFLGQGNYLLKNGYRSKSEIMKEHLERVYPITEKYGLYPIIWSDMFFRDDGGRYYDSEGVSNPDILKSFPNLTLAYWDYHHEDPEFYIRMFEKHHKLTNHLMFVGSSSRSRTFSTHHEPILRYTNAAFSAVKNAKLDQVFTTIWGDNSTERNTFSVLPTLIHFAEHFFTKDTPDELWCAKRLEAVCGENYEDFVAVSKLDEVEGYLSPNIYHQTPSRILRWQDVLLGLQDENRKGFYFSEYYSALKERFAICKENSKHFSLMFDFYENVANVLAIKADIGHKLVCAYKDGNTEFLKEATEKILPELVQRAEKLRRAHRTVFLSNYKAVGWEVLDIRYGGMIARVKTAIDRLNSYLSGEITEIEELLEPRLMYMENEHFVTTEYQFICSASRL